MQDKWIDSTDSLSVSVSNDITTDDDTKWDNDETWNEILLPVNVYIYGVKNYVFTLVVKVMMNHVLVVVQVLMYT